MPPGMCIKTSRTCKAMSVEGSLEDGISIQVVKENCMHLREFMGGVSRHSEVGCLPFSLRISRVECSCVSPLAVVCGIRSSLRTPPVVFRERKRRAPCTFPSIIILLKVRAMSCHWTYEMFYVGVSWPSCVRDAMSHFSRG